MHYQKSRNGVAESAPPKPILAARQRRLQRFFSMGPAALSICSVTLISLMAILYLSQLGQAVSANQQIQDMHMQQAVLSRQDQDLVNTIATEQSPGYIAGHARAQGLGPADATAVRIIVVKHLEQMHNLEQDNLP